MFAFSNTFVSLSYFLHGLFCLANIKKNTFKASCIKMRLKTKLFVEYHTTRFYCLFCRKNVIINSFFFLLKLDFSEYFFIEGSLHL